MSETDTVVPDFLIAPEAERWLADRLAAVASMNGEALAACPMTFWTAPQVYDSPLGALAVPEWRRFALAALAADWACYPKGRGRMDFPKLMSMMAAFPAGFRVWVCLLPDGSVAPVGYAGWYPISRAAFDLLHDHLGGFTHRGAIQPEQSAAPGCCVHLYNFSIAPQLRGTVHSTRLMRTYIADVVSTAAGALSTIAISEDGARVARRLGLHYRGDVNCQGEPAGVYTVRFA